MIFGYCKLIHKWGYLLIIFPNLPSFGRWSTMFNSPMIHPIRSLGNSLRASLIRRNFRTHESEKYRIGVACPLESYMNSKPYEFYLGVLDLLRCWCGFRCRWQGRKRPMLKAGKDYMAGPTSPLARSGTSPEQGSSSSS